MSHICVVNSILLQIFIVEIALSFLRGDKLLFLRGDKLSFSKGDNSHFTREKNDWKLTIKSCVYSHNIECQCDWEIVGGTCALKVWNVVEIHKLFSTPKWEYSTIKIENIFPSFFVFFCWISYGSVSFM